MRNGFIQRRLDAARRDDGIAIIIVMSVGIIISALLLMLTEYSIVSVKHARAEQDTEAALSAAQSGVDDFLFRLNGDAAYWKTLDCTNLALNGPPPTGQPTGCSYGSTTPIGWVTIAGANDANNVACAPATPTTPVAPSCARYHYTFDSSPMYTGAGTILLASTGRSKNVTRTISATIRRQGFGDFMYFTDFESADPANRMVYTTATNPSQSWANTNCNIHAWEGRNAGCGTIYFFSGDVVNGPIHSNDTISTYGNPTFNALVTTSDTGCRPNGAGVAPPQANCYNGTNGGPPVFAKGIKYAALKTLPPANIDLKNQAIAATSVGAPGCMFTGPTRLEFVSNGTVRVWSPKTTAVNPGCGTLPFPTAASGGYETIAVPQNNVIYVQSLAGASTPCGDGDIGGYPRYLPSGTSNKFGYDINADYGDYNCSNGTVFVNGVVNGRVTVGVDNDIILTDDITYANGTSVNANDTLGLVAGGAVKVYHPIQCTRVNTNPNPDVCDQWGDMNRLSNTSRPWAYNTAPKQDINIQAALLSLTHDVSVQAYSYGSSLGHLNVFGSIAQKYRGIVGQGGATGTGYLKAYTYDTRLGNAPPPYYLNPVASQYIARVFGEAPTPTCLRMPRPTSCPPDA